LSVLFAVEQNYVVRQLMQTMQTGLSRIRSRITRLSWSVLRNQRVEGSPDSDLGPVWLSPTDGYATATRNL
jgi:hypothetical protein